MVKSVFRYLHFLRSYRHVSHYPLESNMAAYKINLWVAIYQLVQRLASGWTFRRSNSGGGENFCARPDRL
jgi:hypothetical protein